MSRANRSGSVISSLKSRGFTMIELIISSALSVIILASMTIILTKTIWIVEEVKAASEIVENAQFLTKLISRELKLAGFYGGFYKQRNSSLLAPDICDSVDKKYIQRAVPFSIVTINNVGKELRACGGELVRAASDILLIRRSLVSKQIPPTGLNKEKFYVQVAPDGFEADRGDKPEAFILQLNGQTAPVRVWQQTIYYVSKDNVFKRRRFMNGQYSRSEPLAQGVDDFQVEFSVKMPGGCNSSQSFSTPVSQVQHQQITAVRFYLLLRSSGQGANQAGKQFRYADTEKNVAINDGGHYALFSAIVPIMNSALK